MEKLIYHALKYKPLIDVLISSIPIVIAVMGGYIAVQQYKTARKKLKLDLLISDFLFFKVQIIISEKSFHM